MDYCVLVEMDDGSKTTLTFSSMPTDDEVYSMVETLMNPPAIEEPFTVETENGQLV